MIKALLFCVANLAIVATALGNIQSPVSRTFSVQDGGTLIVEASSSPVTVLTGPSGRVHVAIEREAKTGNQSRAEELFEKHTLEFSQQGNTVRVISRLESDFGFFRFALGNELRLRMTVTVPQHFHLDIKTSGGSISVPDLIGNVKLASSGGSLRIGNIGGAVNGRTSGGSISLAGARGEAEIRTSGGSIRVGRVDGPLTARTSGGSIRVEEARDAMRLHTSGGGIRFASTGGVVDARTSGGSIEGVVSTARLRSVSMTTSGGGVSLALPAGTPFNHDARSSGGGVTVDFPVTVTGKLNRNAISGPVNGGGPKVELRTSGGGVRLKQS
jgi:DUF4097 and DUF4098 domain-containing protein YvlB